MLIIWCRTGTLFGESHFQRLDSTTLWLNQLYIKMFGVSPACGFAFYYLIHHLHHLKKQGAATSCGLPFMML